MHHQGVKIGGAQILQRSLDGLFHLSGQWRLETGPIFDELQDFWASGHGRYGSNSGDLQIMRKKSSLGHAWSAMGQPWSCGRTLSRLGVVGYPAGVLAPESCELRLEPQFLSGQVVFLSTRQSWQPHTPGSLPCEGWSCQFWRCTYVIN